ncbi:hypothetical protein ACTHGN_000342 [Pseudomonas putida]
MPTENRSSNTEMVSDKLPPCADDVFKNGVSVCLVGDVPKHAAETICQSLSTVIGWKIDWHYIGGRTHIKALAPPPQSHPEPIAWVVGTAIWWTKEEAERDAAATGLPIVGLGPMANTAEVERLREVIKHSDSNIQRQSLRISNQRAQLAEQHALLHKLKETLQREYWNEYAGLEETRELIDAAISASTEKGPKS